MNHCPPCQSPKIVKNGRSWYGKQNYKCHFCKRQAVERKPSEGLVAEELLKRLLLERLSLRAIARVLQVSLGWLIPRMQQLWRQIPEQLPVGKLEKAQLQLYCLEADECGVLWEPKIARSGCGWPWKEEPAW